jgi:hypothetical protein
MRSTYTEVISPAAGITPPDARDRHYPHDWARPEVRLLLACARSSVDADTALRIRALIEGGVDWDFILRKAQQNYIAPLVCTHLMATCADLLPPDILRLFRTRMLAHAASNLHVAHELVRILGLLEDHGVEALPFKGPVLAALAYGNIALRQFGDLDVLVHRLDLDRAVRVITSNGYELVAHETGSSESCEKDVALVSLDGRTRLELHWRLSKVYFSFALDSRRNARRMWDRLETVEFAGHKVRTLPVVDLLLYLCSHGAKHRWERLEWIADVAELLRVRADLDWMVSQREAQALGCERVLALGLRLAHELLDAPLPEHVRRAVLSDKHVESAFESACAQLFGDRHPFSHSLEKHHYRHHLKERWPDRLRLGLTYARVHLRAAFRPNAKDRAMLPVPRYLSFLHYFARPFRLGMIYSAVLLKSLSRQKRPDGERKDVW